MKSYTSPLALAAFICVSGPVLCTPAIAQPQAPKTVTKEPPAPAKPTAAANKSSGEAYPLGTCPISGKKLGSMGDAIVKTYEGREVRFCCDGCPPQFEKNFAKSMVTLDEAIVKDQLALYPLDTSVVSGKKLPEKPIDWVYNNRLVRLGDEAEKAEFKKDAVKYLASLDKAAIQKQLKDYPLKACPVSKEELGGMGEPKDLVVAGRLIRLCCSNCVKDVRKDPSKFTAMIDEARKASTTKKDAGDHK